MGVLDQIKNIKNLGNAVSGGKEVKLPPANTRFDRIINKVSRLPRLFLLFGVCAILIWPVFNPEYFMVWTAAIKTIPPDLWYLIFIIMTSWVGTKFVRDIKQPSAVAEPPKLVIEINKNLGRFNNVDEDDDEGIIAALDTGNEIIDKWNDKHAA